MQCRYWRSVSWKNWSPIRSVAGASSSRGLPLSTLRFLPVADDVGAVEGTVVLDPQRAVLIDADRGMIARCGTRRILDLLGLAPSGTSMDGLRPSSVLLSMTMVWPVASLCRMYIFRGALAVKDDDSTVLSQSSISPSDEPLAAWLAVEDERGMVPPLRKRLRQACLPDRLRTSPARVPGIGNRCHVSGSFH